MLQGGDRLSPVLVAMEQHPLNFSPTAFGVIMHFGPIIVICCSLAKSSSNFSQLREVVMVTDGRTDGGGQIFVLRFLYTSCISKAEGCSLGWVSSLENQQILAGFLGVEAAT